MDERRHEHALFSMEVMNFLMNHSGLTTYRISNYKYFTTDIGEAILTISNIYHNDFRKICCHLNISLKNIERYKEYCELIPVRKDRYYFYCFLKRISLIYELAMFCYINKYSKKDDYKYFEMGCLCIEKCPDIKFFDSVGGWTSLNFTASFLANIGRPLKLIMLQMYVENESILTFVDVVEKLRADYLYSGNIEMLDSKEMACLEMLKELFKLKVDKVGSRREQRSDLSSKSAFPSASAKDIAENEEKVMTVYFTHCQLKALEKEVTSLSKIINESSAKKCSIMKKDVKDQVSGIEELQHVDINGIRLAWGTEIREPRGGMEWNHVKDMPGSISNNQIKSQDARNTPRYLSKQKLDVTAENSERDSDVEDNALMTSLEMSNDLDENIPNKNIPQTQTERKDDDISEKLSRICIASYSPKKSTELENDLSHSLSSEQSNMSGKTKYSMTHQASSSQTEESREVTVFDSPNHERDKFKTECSIVTEENDIKSNFVVPQNYMNCVGSSDECKYLYSAKMFSPSKREKLDESLKTILDMNIINRNYKPMASGDIFVCPPGSAQKEETLVIFVDSVTDDESDEDIYRLICLFKKNDVDFEEKSYNLRPRELDKNDYLKNALSGVEGKKLKPYSTGTMAKTSLRGKVKTKTDSRDRAIYSKYLTKLYKKYLPVILDSTLGIFLRKPIKYKVSYTAKSCAATKRNTVFIITARMLAKRRVQLLNSYESESMFCLLLYQPYFEPKILPSPQQKKLDSYIKRQIYYSIDTDGCVYLVGQTFCDSSTFIDLESWLLFSPDDKSSPTEHNYEMLQAYRLYRDTLLSWINFSDLFRYYFFRLESNFELRYYQSKSVLTE